MECNAGDLRQLGARRVPTLMQGACEEDMGFLRMQRDVETRLASRNLYDWSRGEPETWRTPPPPVQWPLLPVAFYVQK